jgi:hypothetical protein
MKNFDLSSMGVQEMNTMEMKETDGGLIFLLVAAVAILIIASSCTSNISIQVGTNNANGQTSTQKADSTLNGSTFDVPIGY